MPALPPLPMFGIVVALAAGAVAFRAQADEAPQVERLTLADDAVSGPTEILKRGGGRVDRTATPATAGPPGVARQGWVRSIRFPMAAVPFR